MVVFSSDQTISNEDLENTVVDESQRHTENEGPNDLRNEKFSGEFSSVLFSSLAFDYFI